MKHEDIKMDKKVAKKAIGMHDKQMHGGKKTDLASLKKGGMAKKYASGGMTTVESPEKKVNKAADNLGAGMAKKAADVIRENKSKKEQALKAIEGKAKGGTCGATKKYAIGGDIKERIKDSNEKLGASRVKDMTGPQRNIGPKMKRVQQSNASLVDRLTTMEGDAMERGKNREKEAINSRTRSAPDYKKGGCTKMAKGGGVESKGKTKGRMI
jgi:hypothetical protein